jgi:hypothetical protein
MKGTEVFKAIKEAASRSNAGIFSAFSTKAGTKMVIKSDMTRTEDEVRDNVTEKNPLLFFKSAKGELFSVTADNLMFMTVADVELTDEQLTELVRGISNSNEIRANKELMVFRSFLDSVDGLKGEEVDVEALEFECVGQVVQTERGSENPAMQPVHYNGYADYARNSRKPGLTGAERGELLEKLQATGVKEKYKDYTPVSKPDAYNYTPIFKVSIS